jgi:hypothetical protein
MKKIHLVDVAKDTGLIKAQMEVTLQFSHHHVFAEKCAETLCPVILVIYDAGQEGATDNLMARNCTCAENTAYCCKDHVETYQCPFCDDEEKEEEEEEEEKEEAKKQKVH